MSLTDYSAASLLDIFSKTRTTSDLFSCVCGVGWGGGTVNLLPDYWKWPSGNKNTYENGSGSTWDWFLMHSR